MGSGSARGVSITQGDVDGVGSADEWLLLVQEGCCMKSDCIAVVLSVPTLPEFVFFTF